MADLEINQLKSPTWFDPLSSLNSRWCNRIINSCMMCLCVSVLSVRVVDKRHAPRTVSCVYNNWGQTFDKWRLPLQLVWQEWFISKPSEMNDFTSWKLACQSCLIDPYKIILAQLTAKVVFTYQKSAPNYYIRSWLHSSGSVSLVTNVSHKGVRTNIRW